MVTPWISTLPSWCCDHRDSLTLERWCRALHRTADLPIAAVLLRRVHLRSADDTNSWHRTSRGYPAWHEAVPLLWQRLWQSSDRCLRFCFFFQYLYWNFWRTPLSGWYHHRLTRSYPLEVGIGRFGSVACKRVLICGSFRPTAVVYQPTCHHKHTFHIVRQMFANAEFSSYEFMIVHACWWVIHEVHQAQSPEQAAPLRGSRRSDQTRPTRGAGRPRRRLLPGLRPGAETLPGADALMWRRKTSDVNSTHRHRCSHTHYAYIYIYIYTKMYVFMCISSPAIAYTLDQSPRPWTYESTSQHWNPQLAWLWMSWVAKSSASWNKLGIFQLFILDEYVCIYVCFYIYIYVFMYVCINVCVSL